MDTLLSRLSDLVYATHKDRVAHWHASEQAIGDYRAVTLHVCYRYSPPKPCACDASPIDVSVMGSASVEQRFLCPECGKEWMVAV